MVTMQHGGATVALTLDVLKNTETSIKAELKRFDRNLAKFIKDLESRTFKSSVLGASTEHLSERLTKLLNLERGIINEFHTQAGKYYDAAHFLTGGKSLPPNLPFDDMLISIRADATESQLATLADSLRRAGDTIEKTLQHSDAHNKKIQAIAEICKSRAKAERERISIEVFEKQVFESIEAKRKSLLAIHVELPVHLKEKASAQFQSSKAEIERFNKEDVPTFYKRVEEELNTFKLKAYMDLDDYKRSAVVERANLSDVRKQYVAQFLPKGAKK